MNKEGKFILTLITSLILYTLVICLSCRYTKGTSKTISRHMLAYHGLTNTNQGRAFKKLKGDPVPSTLLLKWLVGSFLPVSIVEDESWKKIGGIHSATEDELLQWVACEVDRVKLRLRSILVTCDQYSVSVEIDSPVMDERYCTVKVTFCTSTERKCLTLAVQELSKEETANQVIERVLKEYDLSTDKIISVTTKGEDEVILRTVPKEMHRTCVLYEMDTLLVTALSSGKVGDLIDELATHVKSYYGYTKSGNLFLKLPLDFDPRVKSTKNVYMLLQKYKTAQTPIEVEATASKSTWTASAEQEYMIQVLKTTLKPFYDAFDTLEKTPFPTVGLSIPILRRIRDVLNEIKVDKSACDNEIILSTITDFLNSLKKSFASKFASILGEDPMLVWTVPLDPRLIDMRGLSEQEQASVKQKLIKKVQDCRLSKSSEEEKIEETQEEDSGSKDNSNKTESSTMGGIFWERGDEEQSLKDMAAAYATSTVDRYFSIVKTHRRIDDPLQWWNSNEHQFPELRQLAGMWFGASPIFEASTEDKRNRYFGENLDMIAFLHENLDLICD